MTTSQISGASTQPTTTAPTAPRPQTSGLLRAAGLAFVVGPVLFVAGAFSSPPQDSTSDYDYVNSMARAPLQTIVSANLLHYSWVLFAVAFLAVPALVVGRRFSGATTVLAVLASLTSIQLSGLLLTDWFAVRVSEVAGVSTATQLEHGWDLSLTTWLWSGKVAVLLVLLTFLALARARVLSWWVTPLPVLFGVAAGLPLPLAVPLALVGFVPAYQLGWQLVTGSRRQAR